MDSHANPPDAKEPRRFSAAWAVVAAFGAYFCMYGFRKPYTVATAANYAEPALLSLQSAAGGAVSAAAQYSGLALAGIDYKTLLIISQALGYFLAKLVGVKIVAEMPPQRRAMGILLQIACAEGALLLVGIVPAPWNFPLLFINGLMLGMVFGLVMGFLEGRCVSEALIAGLCASFILADGVMKSVGSLILDAGVSAFWMPATAGCLFVPPLLLFVWMLSRIPPPSLLDAERRSLRPAMSRAERKAFFARFGLGLSLIVAVYVLATVLRSVRADFAAEIWKDLGYERSPSIFTLSEMWVALSVMLLNGLCCLISNNRRAFFMSLSLSAAGFLLVLVAWGLHSTAWIGGFSLMVLIGVGIYLPYVAVHTTIFERLIAMTRQRGNLGFLMYVADTGGYAAYVVVVLIKNLRPPTGNLAGPFAVLCIACAVLSIVALVACGRYFSQRSADDSGKAAPPSIPLSGDVALCGPPAGKPLLANGAASAGELDGAERPLAAAAIASATSAAHDDRA